MEGKILFTKWHVLCTYIWRRWVEASVRYPSLFYPRIPWVRKYFLIYNRHRDPVTNIFFPFLLVVLFLVYPRRVIQKCIMQPMFDCMFDHILGRFICEKCFAAYLFTNEKYNIFIIGRILYVLAVIPTIQRKEIILFKNVSVFDCIDIMHVGRCK